MVGEKGFILIPAPAVPASLPGRRTVTACAADPDPDSGSAGAATETFAIMPGRAEGAAAKKFPRHYSGM